MHFKEFSTAAQLYFKKAKDTQAPVYSNKLKLTDGQSGILITYPIIDTHNNTINKNKTNEEFKGAVLAGISSDTLTQFLETQLSPLSSANLSLVDSSGKMMLTGIPKLFDANVFDKKFNSLPRGSVADNKRGQTIIDVIRHATIKPRTGSADIE